MNGARSGASTSPPWTGYSRPAAGGDPNHRRMQLPVAGRPWASLSSRWRSSNQEKPPHDPGARLPVPTSSWPAEMTTPETAPYGRSVVAAVPEHTVRPLAWSAPFAVKWRNRIHQRQSFLRVVPVAPVKRTASGTSCPSQIRWRLLPRLARSVRFGPVWSPPYTARMEQLSTTVQLMGTLRRQSGLARPCASGCFPFAVVGL